VGEGEQKTNLFRPLAHSIFVFIVGIVGIVGNSLFFILFAEKTPADSIADCELRILD
jgi:hypothetical protein